MKSIKHITKLAALVLSMAVAGSGCSALLNFDDLTEGGQDGGTVMEAGADATLLEAGTDMAPVEASVVDQALIDQTVIDQTVIDQTIIDQTVIDQTVIDQTIVDQTVIDQTVVVDQTVVMDQTIVDQMLPDKSMMDIEVPDQTIVDQMVPDQTVPDQTIPDQTIPDQTVVDQAIVDQGSLDSTPVASDQSVVEASTPADAYVQLKCGSSGPFYPQTGCCNVGSETVMTCTGASKDTPQFEDCSLNTTQNKCGWNATAGNYGCVTATDPTVDPSGQNPRDCNP